MLSPPFRAHRSDGQSWWHLISPVMQVMVMGTESRKCILGYRRTRQRDWLRHSGVESSIWWFTVIFYNCFPRPRGDTGWAGRRKWGDSHHQWRTNTERVGQRRKKKHVYNLFIQFCIFFSFEMKDLTFLQIVSGILGPWVSEYGFQWRGILNHFHTHHTPFPNFFRAILVCAFFYLDILGLQAWICSLREWD